MPSPHGVKLTPLDTNPVNQYLGSFIVKQLRVSSALCSNLRVAQNGRFVINPVYPGGGTMVARILNLKYVLSKFLNKFMVAFYGWGSTASRLEPLRGGILLFTTNFPESPGTLFIKLGMIKDWIDLRVTQRFWTRNPWIGKPAPTICSLKSFLESWILHYLQKNFLEYPANIRIGTSIIVFSISKHFKLVLDPSFTSVKTISTFLDTNLPQIMKRVDRSNTHTKFRY